MGQMYNFNANSLYLILRIEFLCPDYQSPIILQYKISLLKQFELRASCDRLIRIWKSQHQRIMVFTLSIDFRRQLVR